MEQGQKSSLRFRVERVAESVTRELNYICTVFNIPKYLVYNMLINILKAQIDEEEE